MKDGRMKAEMESLVGVPCDLDRGAAMAGVEGAR